ncbi:MAG: hypothetical protein ACYDBH_08030 [Acidobacteriaceae bacterium]
MTKTTVPCPHCGAPMESHEQKFSTPTPSIPVKQDDREIDHRGVLMPRRTRIGGIIMPQ